MRINRLPQQYARVPTLRRTQLNLETLEDRVAPAAGALDLTFGADGKLTTSIGSGVDVANAVAVQPDGKFVVAGYSSNANNWDFAVVRYNADGSLDPHFGGDGKVTTSIGSGDDAATSLAVQPDGKIVVAGYSFNGSNRDFVVVRYNPDGSLDSHFGGDGKVTTFIGSGDDVATSVALQSDGKIVVAGRSWNGNNWDFALVRYHVNGSLDLGFDADGKRTTTIGSGDDYGQSVAVQPDGKIIVAGYSVIGSHYDIALVRYHVNGSLDLGFDGDGKVTTPIGSTNDVANSLAVQADGKIVVAGYSANGSDTDIAVVRYNPNGSLDTTFDADGKQTTPLGSSSDIASSVAVQPDGKVVVAGYSWTGVDYNFAVVRYNPNGSLDATFDADGKLTTPIGSGDDVALGMAVQADGKIVVAGYSSNGSNRDFAVVRYNADGSRARFSDGTGKVTTSIGLSTEEANAVAVQPDGKIVVAGYSWNRTNRDFAVVRYNLDGSLDASFDGGRVTTPIGNSDDVATSVALQADGKIVVAGYSWNGSNWDFSVVRYNANGSLDTTFDADGKLTTKITGSQGFVSGNSVALQTDGKIIVAGYAASVGNSTDFAVVRYNVNGSLDSSFGVNGQVITPIGSNTSDFGYSVAVQPDGKIVVAGSSVNGSSQDFTVVRYHANGGLDTTFDADGKVLTPIGTGSDIAKSVALQPDGKIIVAGYSANDSNYDIAVVRYNPDGSLDPLFDGDGKLTISIGSGDDIAQGVAVQADGKIVIAGSSFNGSNGDFAVVRLRGDNRAPVPVPTTMTLNEDTPLVVTAPHYFYDPDHDEVTTELLYAPAHGTLQFTPYGTFTYIPNPQFHGTDRFAYKVADSFGGFNVGSVVLDVVAVNDPPVLIVPGPLTFLANKEVALTGITVFDADLSEGGLVEVNLGVGLGTVTLGSTAGLSFGVGDGSAASFIRFWGTLANVNAALATLKYRPYLDSVANDILSISVSDLGNFGTGGVRTDSRIMNLSPAQGIFSLYADPTMPGKNSLVIQGSAADDTITVRRLGRSTTTYLVTINDNPPQTVAGVTGRILVFGLDGNDSLQLGHVIRVCVLDGGLGNDTLVGGVSNDTLHGGSGDDSVNGGGGNDRLTGGPGNDILDGAAGMDCLVESADVDFTLVQGTTRSNGSLTGLGSDVLVRNRIEQAELSGGLGDNIIDASAFTGRTWLWGGPGLGNDVLRGGRFHDVLLGGDGDDQLWGGAGRDLLIGGRGADMLDGGTGEDILIGHSTAYDGNRAALDALMAEWTRPRVGYGTRISHLLGTRGGGANGDCRLNPTTVLNDGQTNTLTGALNLDWFLASEVLDSVTDLNTGGRETWTIVNGGA